MTASARRVERPALLWLVIAIAFAAAALAGLGLLNLRATSLAGPVTLVTQTEPLADALADSPWTGSPEEGPIVWAFTDSQRRDGPLGTGAIAALSEEAMELRIVVVAPRAGETDVAAAIAAQRDWETVRRWAVAGEPPAQTLRDAAAAEGYVEWGRASWDRVAALMRANGVEPRLPLLLWRRGPEWRALVGVPAATVDHVRRDMALES